MKIPLVEQLESVDSRMIEDSPSYVMKLIDEAVDVLRSTEADQRDAARYRWLLENPGDAILVFSEATNQDTYGLERDQIIGAYRIAHYVPERIDELAAPGVSDGKA